MQRGDTHPRAVSRALALAAVECRAAAGPDDLAGLHLAPGPTAYWPRGIRQDPVLVSVFLPDDWEKDYHNPHKTVVRIK